MEAIDGGNRPDSRTGGGGKLGRVFGRKRKLDDFTSEIEAAGKFLESSRRQPLAPVLPETGAREAAAFFAAMSEEANCLLKLSDWHSTGAWHCHSHFGGVS